MNYKTTVTLKGAAVVQIGGPAPGAPVQILDTTDAALEVMQIKSGAAVTTADVFDALSVDQIVTELTGQTEPKKSQIRAAFPVTEILVNFLPGQTKNIYRAFAGMNVLEVVPGDNVLAFTIKSNVVEHEEADAETFLPAKKNIYRLQPVTVPFTVERGEPIEITITPTDPANPATATIRAVAENLDDTSAPVLRGPGGFLVVLNWVDKTISVIQTALCTTANQTGGAWITNPVVATFTLPATGNIYTFERIVYDPRDNSFKIWGRDCLITFVLDTANPANSTFWNGDRTVQNVATNVPAALPAGFGGLLNHAIFVPGATADEDRFWIGLSTTNIAICKRDFSDYRLLSWVYGNGTAGTRLSYVPELGAVFSSDGAYSMVYDAKNYRRIIGTLKTTTPGHVFYNPVIGVFYLHGSALRPFDPRGWVPTNIGAAWYGAGSYCNVATVPSGFMLNGANNANRVWACYYDGNIEMEYNLPMDRTGSANEVGTRDLLYCPNSAHVFGQAMRNGNQTTGVNSIHVYNPANFTWIGRIAVGNLDARSTAPNAGAQIALNY